MNATNNLLDQKSKSLFLDLYRVAIVDGILNKDEKIMLHKIGLDRGVSIEEIHEILRKPNAEYYQIENEEEKNNYLADITKIIISDGNINDEEIFLWDKIAEKFFNHDDGNELLKKETFNNVIEAYIENEINKLKDLRVKLLDELEDKINVDKIHGISTDKYRKIEEEIKQRFARGIYVIPQPEYPRFFVLGTFKLTKSKIRTILRSAFKRYGINLPNNCFNIEVSSDYSDVKKVNKQTIINAQNGEYTHLIYGPHPHKLNGRKNEVTWEKELENTQTYVKGNFKTSPSESEVKRYADYFAEQWFSLKSKN